MEKGRGANHSAPDFFTASLPMMELDAELYLGRGRMREIGGMAFNSESPLWRSAKLMVFDAPSAGGGYRERHAEISSALSGFDFAGVADFFHFQSIKEIDLAGLQSEGGEGFMLRDASAGYRAGRHFSLLKLK